MIEIVIMFASHCSGYKTSNFPVPMCTIETSITPLLTLTPPPSPPSINRYVHWVLFQSMLGIKRFILRWFVGYMHYFAQYISCEITCFRFLEGMQAILQCRLASLAYMPSHYSEVIMSAMASQITSLTIVYSTVYSGADQRKQQSSASLTFVRGIHR